MTKRVLVGYRDDDHGDDAVALARVLASAGAVESVLVVQAVHHGGAAARTSGERRMAPVLDGWPQHVSVSARAVTGDSGTEALRLIAEAEGTDLMVLGSTHRGFAGRAVAGTTAGHLLRDGTCPMLVAPPGFRDSPAPLRTVGVAFDGSAESHVALEWAAGLASELGLQMRLIAVVEPPPPPVETWGAGAPGEIWAYDLAVPQTLDLVDAARGRMRQELAAARSSLGRTDAESVTLVGDPLGELRDAAEDLDLLIVGSRGHGRLAGALLGSVAGGLLHLCPAPLAVVPRRPATLRA